MAEQTIEERLNELKQKQDYVGDPFGANDLRTLIEGIEYAMSHGGDVSVAVTPVENGYKITITDSEGNTQVATVQNGGDAYDVYVSTVPQGQTPMSKTEWLASLKGEDGANGVTPTIDPTSKHWMIGSTDTNIVAEGQDGAPGHNPCLGRFNVLPTLSPNPFADAREGDYIYFDTTDQQTSDPVTYIYYFDGTDWDTTGTLVDVSNLSFGSGQDVVDVAIKDLDGKNNPNSQGVLSAEAGKNMHDTLFGESYDETNSQATSGSYWKNTDGSIDYGTSSTGLSRVNAINVQAGKLISLTTTLGNTTADAAYFTDNNGVIKGTINRTSNTTTFEGVVPDGATKLYVNYKDAFSVQLSGKVAEIDKRINALEEGKQDELSFDDKPRQNSANPVKSGGVFNAFLRLNNILLLQELSAEPTAGRMYVNNNDVAEQTTFASGECYDFDVSNFNGNKIYVTTKFNSASTYKVGFITDNDGAILHTFEKGSGINQYWVNLPEGAAHVLVNAYTTTYQSKNKVQCLVYPEYEFDKLLASDVIEQENHVKISSGDVIYGQVNANNYLIYNNYIKITEQYIEIPANSTLSTSLVSPYRASVVFYDEQFTFIEKQEWYSGTHLYTIPTNAKYVRIGVAPQSGSTDDFDIDSCELEVIFSKSNRVVKATSRSDVEEIVQRIISDMNISQDILPYAPDPQLSANGGDDADFDAENMVAQDIYDAFDTLIENLPTPAAVSEILPKYITQYTVVGTAEGTGSLPIKAYILGNRNRFAWKASDAKFAWKNGSTIVYSNSVSPLVGASISNNAGSEVGTVTSVSFNNDGVQIIVVNSTTYTRDNISDVPADVLYMNRGQSPTSPMNIQVYDKNDNPVYGTKSNITTTSFTMNSKTYTRCEDFDYHTEQKGVICIWGNEHGPTSDPREPSIILYRMAKDLCSNCKNNPYLSYLKNNYKIVFIPVVNPFGYNKTNGTGRNNANNVNINRNYPTPGWSIISDNDKGVYPADQSETQYVINTCYKLGSTLAIDIHCLGVLNSSSASIGKCHYEGYIPNETNIQKKLSELIKIMGGLCLKASSYGDGDYTSGSQGADWLHYANIAGGLIEMNSGILDDPSDRHSSHLMMANYTLLLSSIKMWLGLTEE